MNSACELNAMSKEDRLRLRNRELQKDKLDRIVNSMRECFNLTFFGVDVIIEDKTGNYVIIDINNFPAYDGVSEFVSLFHANLIEESRKAMEEKTKIEQRKSSKSSLNDQTGDSSLSYNTSHQVVNTTTTIYSSLSSKICQWFNTLNKKCS